LAENLLGSPTHVTNSTSTQSPAATIRPTYVPTQSPMPSFTLTPEWIWHDPGQVEVPILLYHHISDENAFSRF